jgi:hypothetical protein
MSSQLQKSSSPICRPCKTNRPFAASGTCKRFSSYSLEFCAFPPPESLAHEGEERVTQAVATLRGEVEQEAVMSHKDE